MKKVLILFLIGVYILLGPSAKALSSTKSDKGADLSHIISISTAVVKNETCKINNPPQ